MIYLIFILGGCGMEIATVRSVIRHGSKVKEYIIENSYGSRVQVSSEKLKRALRSGNLTLTNYKLTSDNRLIKSEKSSYGYLLMNKNKVVADFDLVLGLNKVSGKLPIGFKSITKWVDKRKKFSCARNADLFFESIGIKNMEDFIEVFHCISLSDTFWVKKKCSDLNWGNVSPFRNNYSRVVSEYAMEGTLSALNDKNYFSPTISTDGSFPHSWKHTDYGIYFLKAGSKYTLGGANSGQEPYSEYFAAKVCEFLNFRHVDYKLALYKRRDGRTDTITTCKCFTSEQYGSVSAYDLGLNTYENVIEYCKKLSKSAYKTIVDMLFLDCLLYNTDRHFGNIEFIVNNDTLEVVDIAPIFDNNYSFIPRFMDGYSEFDRKDYIARDDISFEDLYRLVIRNKKYKNELIKLRGLKLQKPESVPMKDARLKTLNNFLQNQITYWLDFEKNNKQ